MLSNVPFGVLIVERNRTKTGGRAVGILIHLQTPKSKAARRANASSVKPELRARGVLNIDFHQRSGMRSRCHHFETWPAVAPTSSEQSSRVGQSSMTERKEMKS